MFSVQDIISGDQCRVVEIDSGKDLAIIRFRVPVLGGSEVPGYNYMLSILWAYGEPDQGLFPTPESLTEMSRFEDDVCQLLEVDAHAVLVAVLTLDGARQWVFYTGNIDECMSRLNSLSMPNEPYPIEFGAKEDPTWHYLRSDILGNIDYTT